VIVRDDFGKPLHRMPGADGVVIADALPADYPDAYDALFTMECPEHERTGFPVLPGPVINIDHHLGNKLYGEVNFLDLDAPSVGEMVLRMSKHLGVEIDADIATAMYVSLATDTGFFRYSNTTMRAFDGAREMIVAGADPAAISLWINESLPLSSIRLLGLCLNTLKMFDSGRIATMELTDAFFASVDVALLSSTTSSSSSTALSADEQAALLRFVQNGGGAVIVVDNDGSSAGADAANNSFLAPFGMHVTGTHPTFSSAATITNPAASPVTSGPFVFFAFLLAQSYIISCAAESASAR